jgi:hypothetical protein
MHFLAVIPDGQQELLIYSRKPVRKAGLYSRAKIENFEIPGPRKQAIQNIYE